MRIHLLMAALGGLLVVGCGSKGDTGETDTDATGTGTGAATATATATGTGTGSSGSSFSKLKKKVIVPTCGQSSCHGVANQSGLILDEDTEASDLVGVSAVGLAGAIYVVEGDADASYIIQKLTDAPGIAGEPMPPPFGATSDVTEQFREWIEDGALP